MKKLLVFTLLIFFMAGTVVAIYGAENSSSFTWGFFVKDGQGKVNSLAFDTQEVVASGDLLRIYLELRERSHVYMYLFDSMEDLYLVFPPDPGFYRGEFPAWHKAYIPSGRNWFTLDDIKGTEKFFLLASPSRMADLEEWTERFLADRDDRGLQDDLLGLIQKKVELFSVGGSFDVVQAQVPYGKLKGIVTQDLLVAARTISTTGNYGVALELVNK